MKPIAALTLAICSIASVGFSQDKPMDHSIPNIPMLTWGKSGETTFCGALSIALKPMQIDRSYIQLLGDSSLAFRVRWWKPKQGVGWCPSSPVGEMFPWTDRATQSAGVRLKFTGTMDGKGDLNELSKIVKENIDAGRPMLAYVTSFDVGVIYGYQDDGNTILARDYFVKSETASFPLQSTKTFVGVITPADQPASEKERAIEAIKNAITDWTAPASDFESKGRPGEYLMGDAAYARWIDDLKNFETFKEEDRSKMFQPQWWTFDVLADARMNAATYLLQVAPQFEGEARKSIEAAAGKYQEISARLGPLFGNKTAFLGPWSGKKYEDWTGDIRQTEIDILTEIRAADNAAIEELKKAAAMF